MGLWSIAISLEFKFEFILMWAKHATNKLNLSFALYKCDCSDDELLKNVSNKINLSLFEQKCFEQQYKLNKYNKYKKKNHKIIIL